MDRFLRIAVLCGAIPLGLGMAIFSLWLATRADWLMTAGVLNIALGCVLVAAGGVCLVVYVRRASAARLPAWRTRAFAAGALLFINFPAAIALATWAESLYTACVFTFVNRSALPLEDLVVTGPRDRFELEIVPPGAELERRFHFAGEGEVTFAASLSGRPVSGTFTEYVTPGERATLFILKDGTVFVEGRR